MRNFKLLISFIMLSTYLSTKPHFISFVIPTYNRAYVLQKAIDSVYNQNLKIPFEVICVDDGSTDNSRVLLEKNKAKYKNFRFYISPQNNGAPYARNLGIIRARGDLIFNFDSDNVLEPGSIEPLVSYLDRHNFDCVFFEEIRYFTGERRVVERFFTKTKNNSFNLYDHIFNYKLNRAGDDGNCLFKKSVWKKVGGYPPVRTKDCWGFTFRLLAHGFHLGVLANTFYWHRVSDDGNGKKYRSLKSQCAVSVMREFIHLFASNTQNYLRSNEAKDNYFRDRRKKVYKLHPQWRVLILRKEKR